jgi:tetratricopeptide (TPR) repeat protein
MKRALLVALLLFPLGCKRTGEEDLRKGNVYFTHREWDKANEHYQNALSIAPDSTAAMEALGNVAYEQGNAVAAISWYRKALVTDERAIGARHKLAVALGNSPEVVEILEGTIELAPNDPFAYFALAGVLQKQGNLQKADALYRQTLSVDPEHHAARYALANLEIDDGRLDEAERELERLVKRKQDALAEHGWARLAAKRGDVPTAARHLQKLLQLGVTKPSAILADPVFGQLWSTEAFRAIQSELMKSKTGTTATSSVGATR